jgi:SAM-dependent methyltransferase
MSNEPDTGTDPDPMAAEFDTVAEWTAEAALTLGPEHFVPAGCRGTGGPAGMDWLLQRLDVHPGDLLVDVGAGVGGPAGYAVERSAVRPLLLEPAGGACRAARRLFGYPTVQADATALPLPDGVTAVAWCLGVVCTTEDQVTLLSELRRILRPSGRAGLLVFVAAQPHPEGEPEGNEFPTAAVLDDELARAGLTVIDEIAQSALPGEPDDWQDKAGAVDAEVQRRHGEDPAWSAAEDESAAVGRLLRAGTVAGRLLVVRRADT